MRELDFFKRRLQGGDIKEQLFWTMHLELTKIEQSSLKSGSKVYIVVEKC